MGNCKHILVCSVLGMTGYDAKSIGRRVAAYRRVAGMTAEQLAEAVGGGMTRTAVAKLENGHRVEVSTELLVQIAWALHVPPLALLFPLEEPNAVIELPEASGTSETLGYWIQGISIPDADEGIAQKLGNAIHSEHRRLVVNSLDLLGSIQTQITERGSLSKAEADELSSVTDRSAESMNVGRSMLALLRDRLGITDG